MSLKTNMIQRRQENSSGFGDKGKSQPNARNIVKSKAAGEKNRQPPGVAGYLCAKKHILVAGNITGLNYDPCLQKIAISRTSRFITIRRTKMSRKRQNVCKLLVFGEDQTWTQLLELSYPLTCWRGQEARSLQHRRSRKLLNSSA